jgi:Ca2+/Na+ antiporter
MFLFSICAFFMSIMWISFIADALVDLIDVLGVITHIPPSMLGFTLLAWGNCMGDLNANTAIARKGLGETAITGCMAGPIFNLCIGIGVTMLYVLYDYSIERIPWSLFDKEGLRRNTVVPLILILGTIVVYIGVLANAIIHKYSMSANFHYSIVLIYGSCVLGLVIYVIVLLLT